MDAGTPRPATGEAPRRFGAEEEPRCGPAATSRLAITRATVGAGRKARGAIPTWQADDGLIRCGERFVLAQSATRLLCSSKLLTFPLNSARQGTYNANLFLPGLF
jgi:hypothetical protein